MTLAQLKAFSEVMATGSVSLAARKLYLTQPAVTKQVRALEEELNLLLFERSGKRLLPTTAAHDLLPRVEKLIRGMEGLKKIRHARKEAEIDGVVLVGCSSIFAQTIVAPVIALCRERHPNMQVILFEASMRDQLQRLRKGEFRIAFGTGYAKDAALEFIPFLEDELVLIVPENHELATGEERLPVAEITRQESLIAHYYAGGAEALLRSAGVPRRLLMNEEGAGPRTTHTSTMIALVAHGLGVAVVPRYMVRLLDYPGLVLRELDPPLPIECGYYRLRGVLLAPVEAAFLEVMRETLLERCGA
ncbi:MAG TPA: LysR family transcriptional regulator [Chthoniobacteraceae bacterium]|nr:LysR family transcriptional regulator [Chthoniobacteraceae bacterium]